MLILYLVLFKLISARFTCDESPVKYHFYKIKSCHRSTLQSISKKNLNTLVECKKFANDKHALAFNFSPIEGRNYLKKTSKICEILECPEVGVNSSTLVLDAAYDYYSAYGNNASLIENATCIKSIGLFDVLSEKENYTMSILKCQSNGADLAHVLTEHRTNYLSELLNKSVSDWYKAAYIGLDDMQIEGKFLTPAGTVMECFRFRAWSPGHPRSKHKSEDCVILDVNKTWRTVKCKLKLHAICEFYPERPLKMLGNEMKNVSCSHIRRKQEKRKCLRQQEIYKIYANSSRIDQCALLYD